MTFLIRIVFADQSQQRLIVRTTEDVGIAEEAHFAIGHAMQNLMGGYVSRLIRTIECIPVDGEMDMGATE